MRACAFGCPNDANTCAVHGRKARQQQYDDRRGTAYQRGYGTKEWRAFRAWYLAELIRLRVPRAGLCGARLPGAPMTTDSVCLQHGSIVAGVVVDHIVPVAGKCDPTFRQPNALQLLCVRCHNAKRQRERRS
jgi:hypothetical protein